MIGECTVGSEKSNLSLGGPSNVNFLAILLWPSSTITLSPDKNNPVRVS